MNQKKPDVIVVGGGIIGLLTAYYLSQQKLTVTILERGGTGRESSWAGGGILSPLYPWRYPAPITALAQWSQQHYLTVCQNLQQATGIDPEWQQSGFLSLSVDDKDAALSWAQKWDYELEEVDGKTIDGLEPALGSGLKNGLWMRRIAQVRNPCLLLAVKAFLLKHNVRILEQNRVLELVTYKDKITAVRTDVGTYQAAQVVIAGGAWTSQILSDIKANVNVSPVRGQMIMFKTAPGLITRMVIEHERYVIPRRDGRVLFGSTLEYEGFTKTISEKIKGELNKLAAKMMPELANKPIERHWAGLRPGTVSGVPYIGEHPTIKGLFVNAGQFRNGVVTGLASAKLLSQVMLGKPPLVDITPYRIVQ